MSAQYDVMGIGNAIMDFLAPVSDDFLRDQNMSKGTMTLIGQDRALMLSDTFNAKGDVQMIAGGSGANTMVGIAELGLRGAYIGKTGQDETGQALCDGFEKAGLAFRTNPIGSDTASARCMIAVTPDGERTMNTFLGASVLFDENDVDEEMVRASETLYLEGYLFDSDPAKRAFVKAAEIARAANRKVALTLSDPFCVERHGPSFRQLVDTQCDIVFANAAELLGLTQHKDLELALSEIERPDLVICVTQGSKGSVISDGGTRYSIPAIWVDKVIDTTGAGDQYAAGVLGGRALGLDWADAGHLGSLCAAEVIQHYGARPERSIHELATTLTRF